MKHILTLALALLLALGAQAQDVTKRVFADPLCTQLVEGVSKQDIKALPDEDLQQLADSLVAGHYDMRYRVGSYESYESPAYLARLWNSPGTYYDMQPGVTGINMSMGRHLVAVEGIPEGAWASLRMISYYNGKSADDKHNYKGRNEPECQVKIFNFPLQNGLNVVNYEHPYPALAYVCYLTDSIMLPPIRVHFINGEVNGYITPEMSKAEAHALLEASINGHMDLLGRKVHSVWTSDGLLKYCKGFDQQPDGYADFIHLLDSLVDWEHEVLGYKKYGLIPHNRTFAYVNYSYYFFRGELGVSFFHTKEKRILDCYRLRHNDQDAIWGYSHEWGHLHQVKPYFKWLGSTECTNNINSIYNCLRMGYKPSEVGHIQDMLKSRRFFTTDSVKWVGRTSHNRWTAHEWSEIYTDSKELWRLCQSMSDSVIHQVQGLQGLSVFELAQGNDLRACGEANFGMLYPLAVLYYYMTNVQHQPDFWPDLMERIRRTEESDDKYAMLASFQNGKIADLKTIKKRYPKSYWVRNKRVIQRLDDNPVPCILNFIRQASLTCGYDVTPLFEKYGYLRVLALEYEEYNRPALYLMTQGMYDEYKKDMHELVEEGRLKPLTESMQSEMETCLGE